jgi:hypothetical protein
MRYRIEFAAKKNDSFNWGVHVIRESDDLLQLIFQFQIMIANEFKKIIEESKRIEVNDDIPF